MSTWEFIGNIFSAIFAAGDLAIATGMFLHILSPRHRRLFRATHTFPRIRFAVALFFTTAGVLRLVDISADSQLTITLVLTRVLHGAVLWYAVALLVLVRKSLVQFLDAIASAELGDKTRGGDC